MNSLGILEAAKQISPLQWIIICRILEGQSESKIAEELGIMTVNVQEYITLAYKAFEPVIPYPNSGSSKEKIKKNNFFWEAIRRHKDKIEKQNIKIYSDQLYQPQTKKRVKTRPTISLPDNKSEDDLITEISIPKVNEQNQKVKISIAIE